MEFDSIRPVISGLLGGTIASWLVARWARTLPSHYGAVPRESLLRRHRVAVYTSNGLFLGGLGFALWLYTAGGFAETDPRPMAIGYGIASTGPLLALTLISLVTGRSIREAYVAFAWGQGSPIWATHGILVPGVVALIWGLAKLGT
ncbi:hypothetical protein [Lysobacter sp. N42]|uniref:hypothetical protein n=1 Tax=Lysobacter sp. N42 TaxID=2545719 RepID=UPI001052B6E4|nr:hypothetical protein [Lysobacter sp. N42]TCZ80379.1 hypothetical protein EYQ95_24760 [Lysobacter sp. N42]